MSNLLLLEDKRFYVYAYLDPRKPGKFTYNEYQFDFEPFYIGKGKKQRLFSHLKLAKKYKLNKIRRRIRNSFVLNKILKIQDESHKNPIIIKVKENLNEKEAFDLEQLIISKIGRKANDGPLTNIKDGGEGAILSDETKERIRNTLKEYYKNNPVTMETKALLSEVHKGKPLSEELKHKMSVSKLGKPLNEQHIESLRHARNEWLKNGGQPWNKGIQCSEETKNAISLANKGRHHTNEAKAKISKNHARFNKGKHLSEEVRAKIKEKRRLQIFSKESLEKRSASLKRAWAIRKGLLNENNGCRHLVA